MKPVPDKPIRLSEPVPPWPTLDDWEGRTSERRAHDGPGGHVTWERFERLRQSYEMKVDDFARETLRASTARALAARLWHVLEVMAPSVADYLVRHHDFAPPDEMAVWDAIRAAGQEDRQSGDDG